MAKATDTTETSVSAVEEATTAVAVVTKDGKPSPYLAQVQSGEVDFKMLLHENVGDVGLNRFSMTRIKIPTGGGIGWTIPSLDGPQVAQELVGVPIWWSPMRAFWEGGIGDGVPQGLPPDCSSQDGQIGVGNPGGNCRLCPLNEFGTHPNGRGKACKEIRALFLLREGQLLPDMVLLPPTSIKPLQDIFLQMISANLPYHKVVLGLKLESARNQDGIIYSKVAARVVARLSDSELAMFAPYRSELRPVLEGVVLESDDVASA